MGLLRGMARTAVVAGTATAVSNRVSRRQANRWQQQSDAEAYQQQQAYGQPTYAQPTYSQPAPAYAQPAPAPAYAQPAPAPSPVDDLTDQLQKLANLKNQGILTEEEFASAKARLLNG